MALLPLTLAAVVFAVPPAPCTPSWQRAHRTAMGTQVEVAAWACSGPAADLALAAGLDVFSRLDRLLTTWTHPGWAPSAIQRLNRAAGGPPVAVGQEVVEILAVGRALAAASAGAFDLTVAPLTQLWHVDEDWAVRLPPPAAVARARARVRPDALLVDRAAGQARLRDADVQLDVGGLGKGWAVDAAARTLRAHGLVDFRVQAGGDLYVGGHHEGRPWRVGIRDPRAPGRHIAQLEMHDAAFSTAGDYERSFVVGGQRLHHIVDPATGYPATACRSVTVLADSATWADGLGDAAFVLGPRRALDFLRAWPGVEAAIVDAAGLLWTTPGLAGRLRPLGAPVNGL